MPFKKAIKAEENFVSKLQSSMKNMSKTGRRTTSFLFGIRENAENAIYYRYATSKLKHACAYCAITIVFLFLILKRGFAYIGIPPIYAGEITIVLFAALFFRRSYLKEYMCNFWGVITLVFSLLPIVYMFWQKPTPEFFLHAFVCYYSIFWYFGFVCTYSYSLQDKLIKLFPYAVIASNVHFIASRMLPLREISPLINGIPLLGNNDSAIMYFVMGIAYAIIYGNQSSLFKSVLLIFTSLLGFLLATSQRTPLVGFLGVALVLTWKFNLWKPASRSLLMIAYILPLVIISGFLIKDDFGEKLKNLPELPSSILGKSDYRSGTRRHRLEMWTTIIEDTVKKDPLFGQGFQDVLVDVQFRNPHNSFVTIFGRVGFVGLTLAMGIYFIFPIMAFFRIKTIRNISYQRMLVFYICFYVSFLSAAMFAPPLEAPYSSLVCNFIFGAFLRCYSLSFKPAYRFQFSK